MGYANVNRPMGFIPLFPVGRRGMNVVTRPVLSARHASTGGNASTDLAVGDAYAIDGATGGAYRCGPTDTAVGIVIGFNMQGAPSVMSGNGPISVDYITGTGTFPNVIGVEDNGAEFEVQTDTFAITNIGTKFRLADAAPDSTYRQSRQTLNVGGGAQTTGGLFVAIALVNRPTDNAFGANARAVVRLALAIQG